MDLVAGIILAFAITLIAIFNYYLNRAPGSDPEDFQIGPKELNLTCDCYLNTIIVAGISALAIAVLSPSYGSPLELFAIAIISFFVIAFAGVIGRIHRYREWREMAKIIKRSVPTFVDRPTGSIDLLFDDEDDDEDE
ncbi:MAG: hypothetical protein ACFFD3_07025 [Candidatus Thorarchaeota archaeon]